MKLNAPAYYQKFACIADKCRHSCCIGWEIDVDEDTMAKYAALTHPYGETIRKSIDPTDIPHFRLCKDERCPHLDERGLCRIITAVGDDCLCDICREHPRFYHDTTEGKEVGLGMACEEACRLILTSDDYQTMTEIDELDGEVPLMDFDTLPYRQNMYAILSDTATPYTHRLGLLSDIYGVSLAIHTDEEWRKLLADLEYLNADHRELFAAYTSDITTPPAYEEPLERALAYFIYRHVTPAWDEDDIRAALGLCLLCERLLCAMVKAAETDVSTAIFEFARILSEEIEYSEDNTEAIKTAFFE